MASSEQNPRSYTPPSDEQLERFVCVMVGAEMGRMGMAPAVGLPGLVKEALKVPTMKEAWLRRHRELQEGVAHV